MFSEYLYTMDSLYIHLLADFDAVFKFFNNDEALITVNTLQNLSDTIDLEIENPEDFSINVYPITKKEKQLFSYSLKLNYKNGELNSKNDYVKIYKLFNNNYIIKC